METVPSAYVLSCIPLPGSWDRFCNHAFVFGYSETTDHVAFSDGGHSDVSFINFLLFKKKKKIYLSINI